MTRAIRARFSKGIIEPLEELDLEDGEELHVTISTLFKGGGMLDALRSTAGGWRDLVDAEELKKSIYADRLVHSRPEPRL